MPRKQVKKKRGGPREGSGRPSKLTDAVKVMVWVDGTLAAEIQAEADRRGISRSDEIRRRLSRK